jgi:hypothetical protein
MCCGKKKIKHKRIGKSGLKKRVVSFSYPVRGNFLVENNDVWMFKKEEK